MRRFRYPARIRDRVRAPGVTGCCLVVALLIVGCARLIPTPEPVAVPESALQRFLVAAESGDAASANMVGYLLASGRVVPPDPEAARGWFEIAARRGHLVARLNLAVLHYLGVGGARDPLRAQRIFRETRERPYPSELRGIESLGELVGEACVPRPPTSRNGSHVFEIFCAGCHGLDGVAAFDLAPSFAFGERMEKRPDELLATIANGHGSMPRWEDKLPLGWLEDALRHAETLEEEFRGGLLHSVNQSDASRFRFGPMALDPWSGDASSAMMASHDQDSWERTCEEALH